MRRVLLVSATAKRGGAERSLAALVRRLPELGWEPVVALLERGPLDDWLGGGWRRSRGCCLDFRAGNFLIELFR
jgi:hypothetical protein